jgi:hypothetical protein
MCELCRGAQDLDLHDGLTLEQAQAVAAEYERRRREIGWLRQELAGPGTHRTVTRATEDARLEDQAATRLSRIGWLAEYVRDQLQARGATTPGASLEEGIGAVFARLDIQAESIRDQQARVEHLTAALETREALLRESVQRCEEPPIKSVDMERVADLTRVQGVAAGEVGS